MIFFVKESWYTSTRNKIRKYIITSFELVFTHPKSYLKSDTKVLQTYYISHQKAIENSISKKNHTIIQVKYRKYIYWKSAKIRGFQIMVIFHQKMTIKTPMCKRNKRLKTVTIALNQFPCNSIQMCRVITGHLLLIYFAAIN